ncbi:MAG TPA: DNA gyrase subunit A [Planctomycetota bacterium]|nr:DNA gyrase subunit A [Planctomycetota bacterium]
MDHPGERIRDIAIEDDMRDAYLRYAMSVIIARALPDVRDGLKPSQRRILVAMHDLNLGPRTHHRKCAKIAGDTSGNYHPHGQEVVYPTLVRMGQSFTSRYPMVDAQGNFGSLDGDPPAAMRYTEARLSGVAMEMLADIEYNTVDYVPNYDETRTEPTVLPGRFPNLLCNGGTGIAVGMATSIPPHNLGEIVDATVRLIDEPDVSIGELIKLVPGPDFPTGGIICGRQGILSGYRTGRGIIQVRAKAFTEIIKGGKKNIVVTEIPYQVTRLQIKEKIAAAVNADLVEGVADMRDESGSAGQRLVIELKRDADEQVVLNQLYGHTPLQSSFSIIMLALVDNRPRTLNLKQLLECFVHHRIEVIRRRTQFLLDRALARAHIIEGLRIALAHIDEIIELIKKARDVPTAHHQLMERFGLSDRQATAILDMRLQRLTGLERHKLEEEYRQLLEQIAEYESLLASEPLVRNLIKEELLDLKKRFGDKRRTQISSEAVAFDREDLIAEEMVAVTLSHEGYIKRLPLSTYRSQGRGGKGIKGADTKEGDFLEHLFIASTHDYLLFFTSQGKVYWQKVYDIPQLGRTSKGRAIANVLSLAADEAVASCLAVRDFDGRQVAFATERGIVKRTPLAAFSHPMSRGIIAIHLKKGDRLIRAGLTTGDDEILLATRGGYAIRFPEGAVRSMGRNAAGVKGIRLRKSDAVVGMVVVDDTATLLTACENGYGKRTEFAEYRRTGRGGKGVINIKTTERNGKVIGLLTVRDDDELMMITAQGQVVRTKVSEIRTISRNTQGVRLINCEEGDRLVAIGRVVEEEEDDEAGVGAAPIPAVTTATDDLEGQEEAIGEDIEVEELADEEPDEDEGEDSEEG